MLIVFIFLANRMPCGEYFFSHVCLKGIRLASVERSLASSGVALMYFLQLCMEVYFEPGKTCLV